jgi:uncharacterized protein (TIGR02611 family)
MKRAIRYTRKVVVLLVGLPLLIVGIILIPLPGPGILITLLAGLLLSLEFSWAERHLQRALTELKRIYQTAHDKYEQRLKEIDEKYE